VKHPELYYTWSNGPPFGRMLPLLSLFRTVCSLWSEPSSLDVSSSFFFDELDSDISSARVAQAKRDCALFSERFFPNLSSRWLAG